MTNGDRQPELDLVARRIEFLEYLREEPQHKPELVDALDNSRSTVDRAIRELEVAGLVERTSDGFATTSTGAAMAEGYREYVHEQESLLDVRALLDVLSPSTALTREAVVDADVYLADGPTPYEPLEHLETAINKASHLRALMPALSNPHTVQLCQSRVLDEEMQLDLVLSPELYRSLGTRLESLFAEMTREDSVSLSVNDQPGFTLLLAEHADWTEVVVALYDDNDALHGVLVNETEDSVRWAKQCYESVRKDARDVTDEIGHSRNTREETSNKLDANKKDTTADDGPKKGNGRKRGGETGTDEPQVANRRSDTQRSDASIVQSPRTESSSVSETRIPDAPRYDRVDELFTVQLAAEGVVRIDESYFDSREPAPPAVAWRTGLDLVDVHAGYAVGRQREREGERENVIDSLVESLLAGEDTVVVGPPGAGKSTACKQVACRWHEADHGSVFYRESGADERFSSVAKLCNQLQNASGMALVVFEDAVREEANAVFEVMRALDGRDDVVFLLDARETEWRNPEEFPVDASLEAYRQAAVETVRVPPLDDIECRRLIERFEELVEADREPSAERLLADVQRDVTVGGDPRAGALFLLLHRLSTYANPLAGHEESVTSLDQDVGQVYHVLAGVGDLAVDVGILINLLNAAGVGIYPEYIHALAADDDDHDQIRSALDRLEGRVVFSREEEDTFRAVHASWSTHFLAHLLNAESEPQRRFGRCVSALLSLADDADMRDRIDWELQGTTVDRIEAAPGEWVDETVAKLFALGRNRPKLAPLYGTTDYSRITLPEACSRETRLRCTAWRGRMYVTAGLVDEAQAEFERLESLTDAPEPTEALEKSVRTELIVESLQGQSDVARQRGDLDSAEEHANRALELARDVGDDRATARSLRDLGRVAEERGDLDDAESRLTESLETFERLGAKQAVAATLADLGSVAEERSDFDEAIEYHEQSLNARRTVGDERGEATCLRRLGAIAARRGEYERAERHHIRSLELARSVGDRRGEATTLKELGSVALMEGNFGDAAEYYRRSLELAEELDDQEAVISALGNLGNVANMRGDLEAATTYYDRTLQRAKSIGDKRTQALVHRNLDVLYDRKDDLETAEMHARKALELHREIGNRLGEAKALIDLGRFALWAGDHEEAVTRLEHAIDISQKVGAPRSEAEAREFLGIVAHRRGDFEEAETRLNEGLTLHRERGHPSGEADCHKHLGKVARDRGDLKKAAEHAKAACEIFEEMGHDLGETNCCSLLGAISVEQGDLEAAETNLERALDRAKELDYTLPKLRALRARSALSRANGDIEAARTDATRSLELAEETGDVFDQANARIELGDVEREGENDDVALEHYEAAVEQYRMIGATGRTLTGIHRIVDVANSPEIAEEWCREAMEMADSMAFDDERRAFRTRLDDLTQE